MTDGIRSSFMEQRCITTVVEPAHNGHPLIARDAMSRSTLLATALSTLLLSACASSPATPATAATSQPSAFTVEVPAISRPQGETAQWWYRHGAAEAAARGAMAG